MKVIIVGEGEVLFFLSRAFIAKGHEITIVSPNENECIKLTRRLKVNVINGDGSDTQILKDAGAMGANAILAVTPHDEKNLIICQIASLQFGVPRALALANDPDNEEIFTKLGIDAFSTALIITNIMEQRTSIDQICNLLPIGEGKVNVTEIELKSDSPVIDMELKNLELPQNALIAVIIRNDKPIIPHGSSKLLDGDKIVLITMPENHGIVLKKITGEI